MVAAAFFTIRNSARFADLVYRFMADRADPSCRNRTGAPCARSFVAGCSPYLTGMFIPVSIAPWGVHAWRCGGFWLWVLGVVKQGLGLRFRPSPRSGERTHDVAPVPRSSRFPGPEDGHLPDGSEHFEPSASGTACGSQPSDRGERLCGRGNKPCAPLGGRCDPCVVETDVHYPRMSVFCRT